MTTHLTSRANDRDRMASNHKEIWLPRETLEQTLTTWIVQITFLRLQKLARVRHPNEAFALFCMTHLATTS